MNNTFLYTKRLNGDGSASDLPLEEWKKERKPKWVHFQLSDDLSSDAVMQLSGISELVLTALTVEDSRPRAVEMDGGHLVCLRGVNCNPGEAPEDMVSIRLWINKNMIVSCRHEKVEAIKDITAQFESNSGPCNTEDFLLELCDSLTYRISDTVNQLEDQVDVLEENFLENDMNQLRSTLYITRRKIIHMRRHISPQRESLLRFSQRLLNGLAKRIRCIFWNWWIELSVVLRSWIQLGIAARLFRRNFPFA